MYWRTKKATYGRALVGALLGTLKALTASPLLATPKILLFTAAPALSPDFDPATLTEATFHGYAATAVTLGSTVNIGGTDQAILGTVDFVATSGGTIADTCIGYAVVDNTKAIGYMIELFANPISFGLPGDFLQLDLVLPLPMVYTPVVS
jgi:hypothetical protein